MRSTLILITLATVLVSCGKKENTLGSSVVTAAFEQKDFLTIPHEENASLIRSKLLNIIVEQTFPAQTLNPENSLKKNDELKNFDMSERDLRNYQDKEKGFSKVIVSYPDREEVYFVPERVLVVNLVSELELAAGTDRVLKMLPSDNDKTFKGGVFYIVSLNHSDLMKNDQRFYSIETSNMKNLTNQSLLIDSFKSVILSIDYDFYIQKLVTQSFATKAARCTRDTIESGECGRVCSYKRDMPAGDFEKASETSLNNLGLSVKYADRSVGLNDVEIVNKKDGHFEVKIENVEALADNFTLQIAQSSSATYQRSANGYAYSNDCQGHEKNIYGNVTIQSKVNFSVTMTTFGRGAELKKIKL